MPRDAKVRVAKAKGSCAKRKALVHTHYPEDTKQVARSRRVGKHELARARRLEDQAAIQEEGAGHDMDRCNKHHMHRCPDCHPMPEDEHER